MRSQLYKLELPVKKTAAYNADIYFEVVSSVATNFVILFLMEPLNERRVF